VVETETDDDGIPVHNLPPWVVNEAGEALGDRLDEDSPGYKKSDKAKARQKAGTAQKMFMDFMEKDMPKGKAQLPGGKKNYGLNPKGGKGRRGTASTTIRPYMQPKVEPKPEEEPVETMMEKVGEVPPNPRDVAQYSELSPAEQTRQLQDWKVNVQSGLGQGDPRFQAQGTQGSRQGVQESSARMAAGGRDITTDDPTRGKGGVLREVGQGGTASGSKTGYAPVPETPDTLASRGGVGRTIFRNMEKLMTSPGAVSGGGGGQFGGRSKEDNWWWCRTN